MAVEILDGTIEPAEPVRSKRKYLMFDTLRFRGRDGSERQLKKICCGGEVGVAVRRGGSGRFYMSSGGGQTGIHGVRMDDGTKAYAHYNNMELVTLIGIAAGMILLVVGIVTGEMMIIPVVIGFLLIGAYFYLRGIRVAGQKQFDADNA
jgi:hypothetical protein